MRSSRSAWIRTSPALMTVERAAAGGGDGASFGWRSPLLPSGVPAVPCSDARRGGVTAVGVAGAGGVEIGAVGARGGRLGGTRALNIEV